MLFYYQQFMPTYAISTAATLIFIRNMLDSDDVRRPECFSACEIVDVCIDAHIIVSMFWRINFIAQL